MSQGRESCSLSKAMHLIDSIQSDATMVNSKANIRIFHKREIHVYKDLNILKSFRASSSKGFYSTLFRSYPV
ncbi:hypothetical protein PanWU01x14_144260 [Parasponia andersonii]|uniref:Uncharacterized protein n=1 Tax=Parasponia andersonii TaxID=3476 RepID=A0A2P5CL40_PARAD|nr:hypothetical protein PanWU01x14_144260 [Parasponia andersonii]